jgi:hypothetical protein
MSARLSRRVACAALALLLPAPARGADASRFPLARAVPDDVYIMVAARHNPERDFLDQYWSRVFDAFARSGVCEEVWNLVSANIPEADADRAEDLADTFRKLLEGVRWGELFAKESVYCQRVGFPAWDNVVLTQQTPESVERNFAGLKAILSEVARAVGDPFELTESKFEGATLCRLSFGPGTPFSVTIARRNTVLALGLGEGLLKDVLSMLAGQGKQKPLVSTPRFKAALASLPEAEDAVTFVDVARMMSGMRDMFGTLAREAAKERQAEGNNGGDDPAQQIPQVLQRIIDDLSIWDYSVTVSRTNGFSTIDDSLTTLTADAKSRRGYRLFVPTTKFEDLDRLVPKEAADFSVSDGLRIVELYDWILGIIGDAVPEGRSILEQWQGFQKEHEFDLRRDVLELIEGPVISVTFADGGGWAFLTKVRSEKKAARQMRRLIEHVQALLGDQQGLLLSDAEVAGQGGFQSVSHPLAMMMQIRPIVWGTAKGYLVVGSGTRPIATCLKTLAGEHPGISTNARFRKEGAMPKGPFTAASFTDTSKTANDLQAALTGITMGLGMLTAFAPAEAAEGGKFLKAIPSITGKLVKVVSRLDFFLSDSSNTTFDGKAWRTTSITNYKDPAAIRKSADDADEDDEGDDSDRDRPPADKTPRRPVEPADDE